MQFPQNDLNYLFEISCRFLTASTAEGNRRHSKPAAENESRDEGQEGVSNTICKLFQQQGTPEVELDKFSGNPLEYQYFSTMFKEVVERKIKDALGKLTRLVKFTDGEAKDLIQHCIHLTPDAGYHTTITLLSKRYGIAHSLLTSYRKEIKSLAPVKPDDAMGFRKFHNFFPECKVFSKSTNWNSLETPETLCVFVSKLPGGLRDRWNRTRRKIP